jgi:hypothetical protein
MVTRTRLSVTLYVQRLSYSIYCNHLQWPAVSHTATAGLRECLHIHENTM